MTDGMDRRRFLKVLGVTGGGAAVMGGCSTDQVEKFIPYLVPVENQLPGVATWYATTCRDCSAGCGLHVRTLEGRAVKVEGNPDAPLNRGKTCARAQASLQGTYNPDRVRGPMARTAGGAFEPIAWDAALDRVRQQLAGAQAGGVWFVTGNETGTFDRFVGEWLRALGAAHRVVYEPFGYEALRHAHREVFGVDAVPVYRFADANYILSFGADFLETWIAPVEHARGFALSHGFRDGAMGRYVHVEPRMSMTGMSADEWVAPTPGSEGMLALAIAHVILRDRLGRAPADASSLSRALEPYAPQVVAQRSGVTVETIERLAREFTAKPSVALAGGMGAQHPDAHATAAAVALLNYVAGNIGRTVDFGTQRNTGTGNYAGLTELVAAANAGSVAVLFVHGANPVHASPQALGAAAALAKAAFKVSFSRFLDETAMLADLILPDHDPFEQWNDFEPATGVYMLLQPVMQPVFDTRQTGDVLLQVAKALGGAAASRFTAATYHDYLRNAWIGVQRTLGDGRPFEAFWQEALQKGGVWRDARAASGVRLAPGAARVTARGWSAPEGRFALIAYPSPALFDGRSANRPWLQELPDPVTKITWSTWVELHPDTAQRLGIFEGDIVEVTSDAGSIEAPAYLYPGIRQDTVAMPLGQGHTAFGRYAQGVGANVYALLPGEATAFGGIAHYAAVTLRHTGRHEKVAKTEGKNRQMGRGIAQAITLAETEHGIHPFHIAHAAPIPPRVEEKIEEWQERHYAEWHDKGNYAGQHPHWAMVIDLTKCTGCSACVTACSAENNIPHVGKDLVRRGREMMWMRIERYFEGGGEEPLEARFLPMFCQQCGNAPCEPVCPVFAAYHTPDGLNGQVYNRCVGTRYCSNNCPYKVRYFNWFDSSTPADPRTHAWPEPMHWLLNPDVTVRSKGVMEKCTFCVQRIRGAQHQAKMADTPLKDGDVVTACAQACPSDAIVFGDIRDPASRVSQLAPDARGYHVLDGLNTRPSVTYLMKVRNVTEA